jgi:NitT/TauT family transport system ATP-binding protein
MIEVDIKRKIFGETEVLRDVSFTVAAGESVAITGPSGIGKSTILRIMSGIDTDYEGHVRSPDNIAMVFQEPTLLPWRSVLDNILLVHQNLEGAAALQGLERVGLQGKGSLFPAQLSLGQQRRLALARAFAAKPDLLILDEPFVSLDEELAAAMVALTQELIAEHRPATVFVTHDAQEAEALAHRILRLSGSPATI